MREQTAAMEVIQAFLGAWFQRRDADGAAALLTEDVGFVGTGERESAQGRDEMAAYIRQDIREIPEPFQMELLPLQAQRLGEHMCNYTVELKLKNSYYTWRLRGFFILEETGGDWRIKSLHVAEPSQNPQGGEHYPQAWVLEHIAQTRQELLNDSLAGGMMGGYLEEGFP